MKKVISIILMIFIVPFSTVVVSASNKQIYYGADFILYYELNENNEITITSCESANGKITIPNTIDNKNVSEINSNAFCYNEDITEVFIPANVNTIGREVFVGCNKLKSITVEAENLNYKSSDGILYDKTQTELICCPSAIEQSSLSIPKSVTTLSDYAFYNCTSLERINIPDSVTHIGSSAFSYCTSLLEIVIPNSVTKLETSTFADCTNLANISIPATLTNFEGYVFEGTAWVQAKLEECSWLIVNDVLLQGPTTEQLILPEGIKSIANYAFYNCYGIKKITIPEGVTIIGNHSFSNCPDLTDVVLPNSLTEIGEGAFDRCWQLESINIPSGIAYIGRDAFNDTKWLTTKQKENSLVIENGILIDAKKYSRSIAVLTDVRVIASEAFAKNENILNITIPETVKYINDSVFYLCTNLHKVEIANGLEKIGASAFSHCSNIEEIIIPDSVVEIGSGAFFECSNLRNVVLSKNITTIQSRTFGRCGFVDLEIPKGITCLEEGAFMECSSITTIKIPDTVVYIEENVFKSCYNLFNISVPNSVEYIGNNAFHITGNTLCCYSEGSYFENYLASNHINVQQHDWDYGIVTTEPTCSTSGEAVINCKFCHTKKVVIVEQLNHNYSSKVTIPTCTENGYTTYTCTNCDDTYKDNNITATGHKYVAVVTKPTYTECGYTNYTCSVCSDSCKDNFIPALGKVNGVSVDSLSLTYKDISKIVPKIKIDDNVDYKVEYYSSNPAVVLIDKDGNVVATGIGEAEITVTVTDEYGNVVEDACKVTVSYSWWQWLIIIFLFGWIWY